MVTRTQIAEADVTGWSGVIYTCNCGYFDLGHGNPHKAAWNVGASALWEQLVKEPSDNAVVEQFRRPPMGEPGADLPIALAVERRRGEDGPRAQLCQWRNGGSAAYQG